MANLMGNIFKNSVDTGEMHNVVRMVLRNLLISTFLIRILYAHVVDGSGIIQDIHWYFCLST